MVTVVREVHLWNRSVPDGDGAGNAYRYQGMAVKERPGPDAGDALRYVD